MLRKASMDVKSLLQMLGSEPTDAIIVTAHQVTGQPGEWGWKPYRVNLRLAAWEEGRCKGPSRFTVYLSTIEDLCLTLAKRQEALQGRDAREYVVSECLLSAQTLTTGIGLTFSQQVMKRAN